MSKIVSARFDRIGEKREKQVGELVLGDRVILEPPRGKDKLSGGPYIEAPGFYALDSKGKRAKSEKIWLFTWTSKMSCPSFSLPAGPMDFGGTCPAAEAEDPNKPANQDTICTKCYAGKNLYLLGNSVIALSTARYEWAIRELASGTFVDEMTRAIRYLLSSGPTKTRSGWPVERIMSEALVSNRYFRIHDAGDMFSPDYYRAWAQIASNVPEVRFWAPTRVWAKSRVFLQVLQSTALPRNLTVRPSALYTSAKPPDLGGPLAAGSTSFKGEKIKDKEGHVLEIRYPAGMSPQDLGIWDCPAFLGEDEHSCMAAKCRTCWDSPQKTVSYMMH